MAEVYFFSQLQFIFIAASFISVKVHLRSLISNLFIAQVHSFACLFT